MKRPAIIILFLFVFGNLIAQDSTEFTLQQAQEYALKNNYDLHNAELDIEASKKKIFETTAIGLPQISAEGQMQNFLNVPTMVLPANAFNPQADPDLLVPIQFGVRYKTTATLKASQMIFNGSYFVGLQAAKTYKQLSQKQYKQTEIEVKNNVAQAYYTVLLAKENLNILDTTLTNTKKIYDESNKIYEQGLLEKQDVDQLQLNVMSLKNMIDNAKKQFGITKKLLKLQMGKDVNSPITLTDNFNNLLQQKDDILEQKFTPEQNIQYAVLETNKRLKSLNVSKEKSTFLPTVSAFFSYQKDAQRNQFDIFSSKPWFTTSLWGIQVNVPIFDGGSKFAKVSQARIALDQVETSQRQLKQSLIVKYQKSQADFISAKKEMKNKKQSLKLAKSIYNRTLKKYKLGMSSSLDLSQTQNQYLSSQGEYIQAIFQLLKSKDDINKLLSK